MRAERARSIVFLCMLILTEQIVAQRLFVDSWFFIGCSGMLWARGHFKYVSDFAFSPRTFFLGKNGFMLAGYSSVALYFRRAT